MSHNPEELLLDFIEKAKIADFVEKLREALPEA